MRNVAPIEKRLLGSLKYDAINGDSYERSICGAQMKEAATEITRLRAELLEAGQQAEQSLCPYIASSADGTSYCRLAAQPQVPDEIDPEQVPEQFAAYAEDAASEFFDRLERLREALLTASQEHGNDQ